MTAPIQVEVAADGRGVLVAGDDRWTFDLDLDGGTAELAARATGGEPVRVRPLRWREKLALARFAGLDEAFLARAVAATCASGRPTVGPDDATVAALAVWLEGPAAAAAIGGSDPERLAAMTVDLCRLTGLRPSDLDDLPAGEVAQLWLAASGAAGDAGTGADARRPLELDAWSAGATRIEVIDDRVTDLARRRDDAATRDHALDDNPSATDGGDAPTGATPAERAPNATRAAADPATPEADTSSTGVASVDGPARPARPAPLRAPAVALRRARSDPPTLVGGPRVRGSEAAPADENGSRAPGPVVTRGVVEPTVARTAAPGGSSPEPVDRLQRDAVPGVGLAESSAGVPVSVGAGMAAPPTVTAVASSPMTPPPAPGRTRPTMSGPAAADPRVAPRDPFPPGAITLDVAAFPPTDRPVGSPLREPVAVWADAVPDPDQPAEPRSRWLDRSERDALFQALADELELAAAELGIGSEA